MPSPITKFQDLLNQVRSTLTRFDRNKLEVQFQDDYIGIAVFADLQQTEYKIRWQVCVDDLTNGHRHDDYSDKKINNCYLTLYEFKKNGPTKRERYNNEHDLLASLMQRIQHHIN